MFFCSSHSATRGPTPFTNLTSVLRSSTGSIITCLIEKTLNTVLQRKERGSLSLQIEHLMFNLQRGDFDVTLKPCHTTRIGEKKSWLGNRKVLLAANSCERTRLKSNASPRGHG